MGNRSLDDFVVSDGESETPSGERSDGDGADETADEDAATDATPSDDDGSADDAECGADGESGVDADERDDREPLTAADDGESSVAADDEAPPAADGEPAASGDGSAEDDGSAAAPGDTRVDPETVEAAASTYAWSGDGGVCGACEETVDRRWRQDGALVCPDCKEW